VASHLNPTTAGFAMTVDGEEGHAEQRFADEREGIERLVARHRQVLTEGV